MWAILAAVGCASSQPPPELVDARAAYNRAQQGPAAQYDPAALHSAQVALKSAEDAFENTGDSPQTRDLAYTAHRKAQLAEANAGIRMAQADRIAAQNDVQITQAQIARTTQGALQSTQQQLDAERARREAAEKAAADLERIAKVKQDERGTVITLSGSVLFASGKSTLLPAARSKLNEVANALERDKQSKMTVEGYTDSTGSASTNSTLSQKRADVVRDYLVSRGIASDRIDAVGKGPDNPIADNSTAEGRANNRRVEIVVHNNSGGGAGGGMTPKP